MRKAYISGLVITSILAFVFLIPDLTFWGMFFTLGLVYFIAIPVPYIFLALWLAFPAYKLRAWKPAFWSLLALGALAFAAILFGPPLAADARFQRELAAINQPAQGPLDREGPIGVEIRRVNVPDPDLFEVRDKNGSPLARARFCMDLCERLLTGGDVAWVRMVQLSVSNRGTGERRVAASALLVHAEALECQQINPDFAGERCVLFVPDHDEPAQLTLEMDARMNWDRAPLYRAYFAREVLTAFAFRGKDTGGEVLFKLGRIQHLPPTGRILPSMRNSIEDRGRGGWRFERESVTSDAFDLSGAVEQLGLALGPLRNTHALRDGRLALLGPPVGAQDAAYVASLLEPGVQEAERTFPSTFQSLLQGWYGQLQTKRRPLSEGNRLILCRSLADVRTRQNNITRSVRVKHGSECL